MPVARKEETTPVAPLPIVIAEPAYRDNVVDSAHIPMSDLMVHVEGSPWTVDYYSQVLGADSALSGQSLNRDAPNQQYKKISELVIKVVTALTTSIDPANNEANVTGAANIYPSIRPNNGDAFIADIGDGRTGVFEITSSERRSLYQDAVFFVEYKLVDYLTDQRRGDFEMKTVQKLYYEDDFLKYGQNPIVAEELHLIIRNLKVRYAQLVDQYYRAFMSRDYKVLLVPGQPVPTYDHFLNKAAMTFFNVWDTPHSVDARILNCDDDQVMSTWSIWDMVATRDMSLYEYVFRHQGLVNRRAFTGEPLFEGIYYSGIENVVYPKDPTLFVDYLIRDNLKEVSDDELVPIDGSVIPTDTIGGVLKIKPVLIDGYYIFSEAFYTRAETGQSVLELLVWDYLERKAISHEKVNTLLNDCVKWPPLERFYYIPFLLLLARATVRSF